MRCLKIINTDSGDISGNSFVTNSISHWLWLSSISSSSDWRWSMLEAAFFPASTPGWWYAFISISSAYKPTARSKSAIKEPKENSLNLAPWIG